MSKDWDVGRVRVEVRPGEGGEDAAVFAGELVAALRAWARRAGVDVHELPSDGRTTVLTLPASAEHAISHLAGTHRIQREPRNGGGKRHTSTITIAVLAAADAMNLVVDPAEVDEETFRGTGPGGQHRNKTATDVRLTHRPSGIVVTASGRSQWQNRQTAWAELERRLHAAATAAQTARFNQERRAQVVAERSAKGWTWNAQRDEVIDHGSGRRFRMRRMLAGRFNS